MLNSRIDIIKKNKMPFIQYLLLLVVFSVLCIFINNRIDKLIDSDISTQLVLSKLLADEGTLLSKNWYYATELRVFSYQLVFVPLFYLISNWHLVRVLGSVIFYLLLLASLYYFCRQMEIKKWFPLLGSLYLLPFSQIYFDSLIKNINYIPFFAISLTAIGMQLDFVKAESKKRRAIIFVLSNILAFLSGLNGIRQFFLTYAPMLCAILLAIIIYEVPVRKCNLRELCKSKYFKFLQIGMVSSCFNVCAYIINRKILLNSYSYGLVEDFDSIEWKKFSLNDISNVISGWLANLGYIEGEKFSEAFFHNLMSFFIVFLSIAFVCKIIKRSAKVCLECRLIALFIISGLVMSVGLHSFTNSSYYARFDLLIVVFCFPLIAVYLSQNTEKEIYKKSITALLSFGILFCSIDSFFQYAGLDYTVSLREIVEVLKEEGYINGYATFWKANVTTELSNGEIDVWSWKGDDSDFSSVNITYPWAQIKEHDITHPVGKVFWILRSGENNFSIAKRIGSDYIIYQTGDYTVYGFNNYEAMLMAVSQFHIDFYDYDYLNKGMDIGGTRHLYQNGESYGPYVTLYPGIYSVTCTGTNLDQADFDSVYKEADNGGLSWLEISNVQCDSERIYYELVIEKEIDNYEARFFNNTEAEVCLQSLDISALDIYDVN